MMILPGRARNTLSRIPHIQSDSQFNLWFTVCTKYARSKLKTAIAFWYSRIVRCQPTGSFEGSTAFWMRLSVVLHKCLSRCG
jgi:hypothetical protein